MCLNSSGDQNSQTITPNSALMTFVAVGLSFILILSLVLNGLLCLVFQKRPNLLNASNSFVLNLAICQLGICVLVLPLSIVSIISQQWLLSEDWCRYQGFLFTVFVVTSMLCLAVISIDRHYAISNSLRYPYVFTQFRCNMTIGIGWLAGVSLALPPLIYSDLYGYEMVQFRCGVRWKHSGYDTAYLAVIIAVCYVLPMCIMLWCYCSIFRAALRHRRSCNKVNPIEINVHTELSVNEEEKVISPIGIRTKASVQVRRLDCKASRTILVILTTYFSSWLPYVSICITHLSGSCVPDDFETISVFLVYSSTVVNPIVYGFMNRTIRDELVKYLSQTWKGFNNDERRGSEDSRSQTLTTSLTSGRKARRSTDIWAITTHHKKRHSCKASCMEKILEEGEGSTIPGMCTGFESFVSENVKDSNQWQITPCACSSQTETPSFKRVPNKLPNTLVAQM